MRKVVFILSTVGLMQAYGQQNLSAISTTNLENNAKPQTVYILADKMAAFPGGPSGWDKYIYKNVDFSLPSKNNAPAGRYNVIVLFIINEDGVISDLKALTNFGYGMEEELLRIIAKGPRWIPAIQKGKPVKSYRKQPLTFVVSNKH